jgi:site-specific DNA-cytosine methylase
MTLPDWDIRQIDTFKLRADHPEVRGILAAPPCTEFSLAKNGQERDFAKGLETVCACLRIIACFRPAWWALENPVGYLGRWLGRPRDVFEPHEFGDAWTKRTALWGSFVNPKRGPFVKSTGSAMDRKTAAERAITPPGFARAFFEANP